MVERISVVVNNMLSLTSVMSPPPNLCDLSVHMVVKLCTLGVVFNSVYVDLKYAISLTFTAGSVCLFGVCSHALCSTPI